MMLHARNVNPVMTHPNTETHDPLSPAFNIADILKQSYHNEGLCWNPYTTQVTNHFTHPIDISQPEHSTDTIANGIHEKHTSSICDSVNSCILPAAKSPHIDRGTSQFPLIYDQDDRPDHLPSKTYALPASPPLEGHSKVIEPPTTPSIQPDSTHHQIPRSAVLFRTDVGTSTRDLELSADYFTERLNSIPVKSSMDYTSSVYNSTAWDHLLVAARCIRAEAELEELEAFLIQTVSRFAQPVDLCTSWENMLIDRQLKEEEERKLTKRTSSFSPIFKLLLSQPESFIFPTLFKPTETGAKLQELCVGLAKQIKWTRHQLRVINRLQVRHARYSNQTNGPSRALPTPVKRKNTEIPTPNSIDETRRAKFLDQLQAMWPSSGPDTPIDPATPSLSLFKPPEQRPLAYTNPMDCPLSMLSFVCGEVNSTHQSIPDTLIPSTIEQSDDQHISGSTTDRPFNRLSIQVTTPSSASATGIPTWSFYSDEACVNVESPSTSGVSVLSSSLSPSSTTSSSTPIPFGQSFSLKSPRKSGSDSRTLLDNSSSKPAIKLRKLSHPPTILSSTRRKQQAGPTCQPQKLQSNMKIQSRIFVHPKFAQLEVDVDIVGTIERSENSQTNPIITTRSPTTAPCLSASAPTSFQYALDQDTNQSEASTSNAYSVDAICPIQNRPPTPDIRRSDLDFADLSNGTRILVIQETHLRAGTLYFESSPTKHMNNHSTESRRDRPFCIKLDHERFHSVCTLSSQTHLQQASSARRASSPARFGGPSTSQPRMATKPRRQADLVLLGWQIIQQAVLEVIPTSVRHLPPGTRVCAAWSEQLACNLYPGVVGEPLDSITHSNCITVNFDDGDCRQIPIQYIRMLPDNFTNLYELASSTKLRHSTDNPLLQLSHTGRMPLRDKSSTLGRSQRSRPTTDGIARTRINMEPRLKDMDLSSPVSTNSIQPSVTQPPAIESSISFHSPPIPNISRMDPVSDCFTHSCPVYMDQVIDDPFPDSGDHLSEAVLLTETTTSPPFDQELTSISASTSISTDEEGQWQIGEKLRRRKPGYIYCKSITRDSDGLVVSMGDTVEFSSGNDEVYLGEVREIRWDIAQGTPVVTASWFYSPAEAGSDGQLVQSFRGALFATRHVDENEARCINRLAYIFPTYGQFMNFQVTGEFKDISMQEMKTQRGGVKSNECKLNKIISSAVTSSNLPIYFIAGKYDPVNHYVIEWDPDIASKIQSEETEENT